VAATRLAAAQETPDAPVFEAGVEAVRLDVSVTRDGEVVEGLTAADFEVHDDGVVQEVQLVSGDSRALEAVLVLDTSSSVAGPRLAQLQQAAADFVSGLSPLDAVSVVAFSHRVRLLEADAYDHAALKRAIGTLQAGGGTALNDAIVTALLRSEARRGSPMVLVFTDGRNSLNWLEARHALAAAREMDAVVHGVVAGVPEGGGRGSLPPHVDLLRQLGELTGGELLWIGRDDVAGAFERILALVQGRYVLSYTPRGVEGVGWHEVQVRLRHGEAVLKVRGGYRRRE
jgi:VWFA-related protein